MKISDDDDDDNGNNNNINLEKEIANMKDYLERIKNGKELSQRHQLYMKGGKAMDSLKISIFFFFENN